MKRIICAVFIVCFFGGTVLGYDSVQNLSDKFSSGISSSRLVDIMYVYPNTIGNKEEVIKYFIKSGDVCKIVGHVWETSEMLNYTYGCLVNHPPGETCSWELPTRQCGLCNKRQREKTVKTWEDIK
jgi:hypothetical protein